MLSTGVTGVSDAKSVPSWELAREVSEIVQMSDQNGRTVLRDSGKGRIALDAKNYLWRGETQGIEQMKAETPIRS